MKIITLYEFLNFGINGISKSEILLQITGVVRYVNNTDTYIKYKRCVDIITEEFNNGAQSVNLTKTVENVLINFNN